jgi:hypothetical protein
MKGTCPKAEPGKLPPNSLAGATEATLDQVLLDYSVEVNIIFPEVESAGLSQPSVYVAKFEGDYRVYAIGH